MMDKPKIVKRVVREFTMFLLANNRSLELCSQMNYETENLDFIDSLKQEDVLYDLGACEGRFSIYAGLKGIQVFSFEPEERNFAALKKNLELNFKGSPTRVIPINSGVGAETKKVTMLIGQPWEGGHLKVVEGDSIRQDLKFEVKEKQTIDIVALDEYIESNKMPKPTCLKIDVDGSELDFIAGAVNTLQSEILTKIIFELDVVDKSFKPIIEKLQSFGFKEVNRFQIPDEKSLYNFIFTK